MNQVVSTRHIALLMGVLVVAGAMSSPVDAFTFQPVFSDDIVASVNVDGVLYVTRVVNANALASATGETPDVGALGALVDGLPQATSGSTPVEFQDCEPKGAARMGLLQKGYTSSACSALSGFADGLRHAP